MIQTLLRGVNSIRGPESPWSLPGCATVQALLSAGPSGASDWIGFEDLKHTARGIIDLCNACDPGGGAGDYSLDCRVVRTDTRSPAICCVQVETRHMDCCRIPIQALVNAGCLESFRLQSRRAWGISLPRSDCVIQDSSS